ncbi:hypothetical protein M501DRAFT_1057023 [Patellaria atrata CBS 101060]|uniref:Uncharacterized protein n=1 Tax=Patellaria atrata CBS 101060 TaxID=1346257 RepID=A0A9P4SBZ9_9PEZI|nr:hypothetical protein M501DRAFT_1057023 [Patellaria atrata CBS 101060]
MPARLVLLRTLHSLLLLTPGTSQYRENLQALDDLLKTFEADPRHINYLQTKDIPSTNTPTNHTKERNMNSTHKEDDKAIEGRKDGSGVRSSNHHHKEVGSDENDSGHYLIRRQKHMPEEPKFTLNPKKYIAERVAYENNKQAYERFQRHLRKKEKREKERKQEGFDEDTHVSNSPLLLSTAGSSRAPEYENSRASALQYLSNEINEPINVNTWKSSNPPSPGHQSRRDSSASEETPPIFMKWRGGISSLEEREASPPPQHQSRTSHVVETYRKLTGTQTSDSSTDNSEPGNYDGDDGPVHGPRYGRRTTRPLSRVSEESGTPPQDHGREEPTEPHRIREREIPRSASIDATTSRGHPQTRKTGHSTATDYQTQRSDHSDDSRSTVGTATVMADEDRRRRERRGGEKHRVTEEERRAFYRSSDFF